MYLLLRSAGGDQQERNDGSCSKLRPEYAMAWIEDVDITTHDISEE